MDKNGDGLVRNEEFEEAIVKMAVKDPDTFAEFLNLALVSWITGSRTYKGLEQGEVVPELPKLMHIDDV